VVPPAALQAWEDELKVPVAQLLAEEQVEYEQAVLAGPKYPPGSDVDIGMRVMLVHGDEVISDSETDGGFQGACAKFKSWVQQMYPVKK
jgi:hypothetical protein